MSGDELKIDDNFAKSEQSPESRYTVEIDGEDSPTKRPHSQSLLRDIGVALSAILVLVLVPALCGTLGDPVSKTSRLSFDNSKIHYHGCILHSCSRVPCRSLTHDHRRFLMSDEAALFSWYVVGTARMS